MADMLSYTTDMWSSYNHAPHVWRQMPRTELETAEAQEAQEASQRRYAEERRVADERAEQLLLSCLTAEQRMAWRTRRCFYVILGSGRRYRFDSNTYQGNVKLVNEADEVLSSFCIHLRMGIPIYDHLLAQKLMLEADEQTFMRIANETCRLGSSRVSELVLSAA